MVKHSSAGFFTWLNMVKHPSGSFTVPRFWWNRSGVTISWPFLEATQPLSFLKKYLSLTLTGFCVPKRVGHGQPFFIVQSFARLCPVWARMSLSWYSQCHCWLLMYIHRLCWAYHQLCWLWNLVFRPSAKSNNGHQCLLCAHHRSAQVSERYCPTPPHPTPPPAWRETSST